MTHRKKNKNCHTRNKKNENFTIWCILGRKSGDFNLILNSFN